MLSDVHVYKQSQATIGKYRDVPVYSPGKCHAPLGIFRDIQAYSVIFRHFRDIPAFRVFTTPEKVCEKSLYRVLFTAV